MSNFEAYEYVVKPQKDAKNFTKRISLIVSYVIFIIAWLCFGLLTKIFVPLLALIPLSTWLLVFATWRYVNVEYEYVIESGVITFSNIYGGRSRKSILVFDIRDAEMFLPVTEKNTRRVLDEFSPAKEYSFISSPDDSDSLVALCTDENGAKLAVFFSPDERLLRLCKLYNSAAFRAAPSK